MNKYLPKPAFTFSSTFVFLLGVIFSASTVNADDTDVYLNPSTPPDAEPLVMFLMDHRSSLGSNECNAIPNNATVADIETDCSYSTELATQMFNLGFAVSGDINLLELIAGVLAVVLDKLSGVQVGLLIPHQNSLSGCPTGEAGTPEAGCSNGGYIPFGFQTLTDDASTAGVNEHDVNLAAFISVLANLPNDGLVGGEYHKWQGNEMWFEYYRYLTGGEVWNGHHGYVDFQGDDNVNLDAEDPVAFPLAGPVWDSSIESGADYISPIIGECTKAYALSFSFGVLNGEDDSDDQLILDVAGANGGGMSTTADTLVLSGGGDNRFEQILAHMNNIDLADGDHGLADLDGTSNVTSYFFVPSPSNKENGYADAGGGRTTAFDLDDDPEDVIAAIEDVFASILSVSTTFVAPSVPVNVFNRTQTLDTVFLALFEAEEAPHWLGNLKKLIIDTTDGQLEDVNGNNAIDSDGRILASALTVWTDASTLPVSTDNDSTDTTDGRSVLRGGAGQNIPGFVTGTPGLSNPAVGTDTDADGPRKIYTDDVGGTNNIMALNADATTAADLWDELMINVNPADFGLAAIAADYASATADEQDRAINLIRFARGLIGNDPTDDTTKSDWMTSDPLHSRPITINYGDNDGGGGYNDATDSTANPNIRIAMATNDGGMRMIVNTEADGSESGREAWVFFPRESLPTLNRLRDNALGGGDPVHPYTTDGSPAAILIDNDLDGNVETADGDTVNMFFGQRRGGKCYYSMDITDPEEPKFNWKQCKTSGGDFDELALTFSRPTVGKMAEQVINPAAAVTVPITTIDVLVFGGGYNGDDDGTHEGCTDTNGDDDCLDPSDVLIVGKDAAHGHGDGGSVNLTMPTIGEDDDEGNAVFVVNADDGTLIWKARNGSLGFNSGDSAYQHPNMEDSIPSELAAVDTDGDGLLDRIYFGDTGGRVWRIDMPQTDQDADNVVIDDWSVTEMLNVGRHATNSTATDIRFFNRADVVQATDGTAFDAIIIGSGDRANPLGQVREDTFFMLKDRNIESGSPPTSGFPKVRGDLADLTSDDCATSLTTGSCNGSNIGTGWFIDLGLGTTGTGEKNLAAALTLGGVIFFSTFSPVAATSACGLSEGTGKIFAVNLLDATAVFSIDIDNDSDPDNPTLERFAELDSGGIPVETVPLGGDDILILGSADPLRKTGATTSWKTFWYERDTDDTP